MGNRIAEVLSSCIFCLLLCASKERMDGMISYSVVQHWERMDGMISHSVVRHWAGLISVGTWHWYRAVEGLGRFMVCETLVAGDLQQ